MLPTEDNQHNNGSLHGRATTPVRPGLMTKSVLMGHTPLRSGQYVTEASITDLHNAYKEQLRQYNSLREKSRQLRGMSVHSFMTLFKFARILGLVEHVRDETRNEPIYGNLYRVENGNGLRIVTNSRKIYRLSDKGRQDTESWSNLCGSWREWRHGTPETSQPEEEPTA